MSQQSIVEAVNNENSQTSKAEELLLFWRDSKFSYQSYQHIQYWGSHLLMQLLFLSYVIHASERVAMVFLIPSILLFIMRQYWKGTLWTTENPHDEKAFEKIKSIFSDMQQYVSKSALSLWYALLPLLLLNHFIIHGSLWTQVDSFDLLSTLLHTAIPWLIVYFFRDVHVSSRMKDASRVLHRS